MDKKPVLIVMAAGMGSRFGGLKQITPITDDGDLILDFSIHDAARAGFKKAVLVIKRETEELFRSKVGSHLNNLIEVEFAFQELDDLPAGFKLPQARTKPWGTAHAVLACRNIIDGPFAVINADDYYGAAGFELLYNYLVNNSQEQGRHAMVSYRLDKTVTEHGHVARGVCNVNPDGFLTSIVERTQIEQKSKVIAFTEDEGKSWQELAADTPVSMNFWGFSAEMMSDLETGFPLFLQKLTSEDKLKAEYFLPGMVDQIIRSKKSSVKVLASPDKWYGVTYQNDQAGVSLALNELKEKGLYPLLKKRG